MRWLSIVYYFTTVCTWLGVRYFTIILPILPPSPVTPLTPSLHRHHNGSQRQKCSHGLRSTSVVDVPVPARLTPCGPARSNGRVSLFVSFAICSCSLQRGHAAKPGQEDIAEEQKTGQGKNIRCIGFIHVHVRVHVYTLTRIKWCKDACIVHCLYGHILLCSWINVFYKLHVHVHVSNLYG